MPLTPPAADPWQYQPVSVDFLLARRLSNLLGEPREQCEEAAKDVFCNGRQRAMFRAIVDYAIQLIGPCRELTGQSIFVPFNQDRPTRPAAAPAAQAVDPHCQR